MIEHMTNDSLPENDFRDISHEGNPPSSTLSLTHTKRGEKQTNKKQNIAKPNNQTNKQKQ